MEEVKLPELGENIEDVEVSAVLVKAGDAVHVDQPLLEVETEKASLEVPATRDGVVVDVLVKKGDRVRVGQTIVRLDGEASAASTGPTAEPATEAKAAPEPTVVKPAKVVQFSGPAMATPDQLGITAPAAPSTRALARELGVDVNKVPGSGPGGRINRDDVKAYAKRIILGGAGVGATPAPELPDFSRWGATHEEPFGSVRRATARAMSNSWTQIPHVTQFDRADVTDLDQSRRARNKKAKNGAAKLTMTAIIIEKVAAALAQFPKFNASLDLVGERVIYKDYVNIGVAVDTVRGRRVPVLKDADKKDPSEIAVELNDLASRARNRKLKPDEMQGAGFTISNLGGLGTTYFTPIVNWPEVSILGVGRAEPQAVWRDDQFVPRAVMPLSISYDHRIIDGADAARFLRSLAEALEAQ
ncbi:MAG: 2-oxo acid dehydrogenase subunit E2 [Acidobacteriota bacterium]|nr:2-oxo acid dehydrogenase subunit E2 [Acidobacteriota bacterium]